MRKAILLVCVVAMACGGGKKDPTSPIDPNNDPDVTLGEVCQAVAETTCDKLAECSEGTPPDCIDSFVAACCSEADCDEAVAFEEEVQACTDAMNDLSCEDFLAGEVPSECE